MKLSTRFAWTSAALLPVLIIAAGAALVPWETTDLRAERDTYLHTRAESLAPQASSLAAQTSDPASQVRQALQAPDDAVVLAVHGVDVAVGDAPSAGRLPLVDGAFTVHEGLRQWRGYSASDRATGARVWVVEPESVLSAKVRKLRGRVWLMAVIVSPVAFAVGGLLGRRTIRPLTVLRERARLVSSGTGARIALRTGVDEIDEVAAVLDAALARRDEQELRTVEDWQAARSFAATAAHELRTPLTGIQTALDVLEHPGADAADRREAVADLREAHTRVLGLLEVLRALSRAELARPEQFAEVDLAELAETALHAARNRHPGVRFEAEVSVPADASEGAAVLLGWADGLRMVLDNLLDNAAVHGTDRSAQISDDADPIVLGLSQEPDCLVLTVDDEGPGIPEELRGRVFERFVASEASPGFGLGLTIVAQVIALHQGTVEAGPGSGGRGTRFLIHLPSQGFPKERS
jgi:two-component system sensor histidine kinase PrrB